MIGPSLPHVKGSILILAVIEVTLRVNYINATDRVYGTAIKEYNMRSFASRYQAEVVWEILRDVNAFDEAMFVATDEAIRVTSRCRDEWQGGAPVRV